MTFKFVVIPPMGAFYCRSTGVLLWQRLSLSLGGSYWRPRVYARGCTFALPLSWKTSTAFQTGRGLSGSEFLLWWEFDKESFWGRSTERAHHSYSSRLLWTSRLPNRFLVFSRFYEDTLRIVHICRHEKTRHSALATDPESMYYKSEINSRLKWRVRWE